MTSRDGRHFNALWTLMLGVLAASLSCGAPAAATPTPPEEAALGAPPDDPFEPVNRVLFRADLVANRLLAGKGRILTAPIWIPAPVRAGLYNAFQNLEEPATFANDLFQKKAARAGQTSARFAVNSTVGVLGVIDVAKKLGLERTREDFGQTLAVYGVKSGPYIFLPFAGPTSLRDAGGGVVDNQFSPLRWVDMTSMKRRAISVTRVAVTPSTLGIRQEARAAADAGETHDEYAMVRELYFAQRQAQVHDEPNLADHPIPATAKPKKPKASAPAG